MHNFRLEHSSRHHLVSQTCTTNSALSRHVISSSYPPSPPRIRLLPLHQAEKKLVAWNSPLNILPNASTLLRPSEGQKQSRACRPSTSLRHYPDHKQELLRLAFRSPSPRKSKGKLTASVREKPLVSTSPHLPFSPTGTAERRNKSSTEGYRAGHMPSACGRPVLGVRGCC